MPKTSDDFYAGYVIIRAGNRDVHEVRSALLKMPGVRIAHALVGPDDIICYIEADSFGELRSTLDGQIRKLIDDGTITHTETMLILAPSGRGYSGAENRPANAAAWLYCDLGVGDPIPVIQELLGIPNVVNAHPVLGRYDVVAYLEALSLPELMRILDGNIRHIKTIRRTDTRIVLMDLGQTAPDRERDKQRGIGIAADKR